MLITFCLIAYFNPHYALDNLLQLEEVIMHNASLITVFFNFK
ncbi:MAG: hypothetical protein ACI9Y7_001335 [Dokdonia sp.]|jgi:hypothetical protein